MFLHDVWWRRVLSQPLQATFQPMVQNAEDPYLSASNRVREALGLNTVLPLNQDLHQAVLEFAYDEITSLWKPVKRRDGDKKYANEDSVVAQEDEDVQRGMVGVEEVVEWVVARRGKAALRCPRRISRCISRSCWV